MAYPRLLKVLNDMKSTKRALQDEGCPSGRQIVYACLADFDGDELAFYNNSVKSGQPYCLERYDLFTGTPFCHASREALGEGRSSHKYEWCSNTKAIAKLWPVTTPNLKTLYCLDRGIKLKPGASIPPGTRTFQVNGCVLAEVPEPTKKSLWDGGEDSVWQYPVARSGAATVFDFARHLRRHMSRRQTESWANVAASVTVMNSRSALYSRSGSDRLLTEALQPHADSAQNRAIHGGKAPECKVLAIVDGERK